MHSLQNSLFKSRFFSLTSRLYEITSTDITASPSFDHINDKLLEQLGIDIDKFDTDENLSLLSGNNLPQHLQTVSTVYAGHQFGIYTSKLGDGRVHILGDFIHNDGSKWEIQLKGAGATPFSRGNTGKLTLAEAITEYLGSEAVSALGIDSSRTLGLISSSQNQNSVAESIMIRVAESHLRFGHFEYLHNQSAHDELKVLADHVIENHYPQLLDLKEEQKYLEFLYAVTQRTAQLIASWQSVGFVHSVMNTDNMSILGLTLDLGVYGFMEIYDQTFSPNDNDDQNRYGFDQQIEVGRWNCLALAESLITLLPEQCIPASIIRLYKNMYSTTYYSLMRKKLGLKEAHQDDKLLVTKLLSLMQQQSIDYTRFFRQLPDMLDDKTDLNSVVSLESHELLKNWLNLYKKRLRIEHLSDKERRSLMFSQNPVYILRHKNLKNCIFQAEQNNNFLPFNDLLLALQSPYTKNERYHYLE